MPRLAQLPVWVGRGGEGEAEAGPHPHTPQVHLATMAMATLIPTPPSSPSALLPPLPCCRLPSLPRPCPPASCLTRCPPSHSSSPHQSRSAR